MTTDDQIAVTARHGQCRQGDRGLISEGCAAARAGFDAWIDGDD